MTDHQLTFDSMLRVFQLIFLCASFTTLVAAHGSTCKNPAIRKEWRSLGHSGQKAYADAIKVRLMQQSYLIGAKCALQCLSRLPHNASLTPTGATPGLPPMLSNSSRYDDVVYTYVCTPLQPFQPILIFVQFSVIWTLWIGETINADLATQSVSEHIFVVLISLVAS